jgi:hypothetical protein
MNARPPLLAIDPGFTRTAWITLNAATHRPLAFGIWDNADVLALCEAADPCGWAVIEQVEGMGMAVGREVFETVFWSGRFLQALTARGVLVDRLPRRAVKLHLCGTSRAKDANVRQALVDRYGPGDRAAKGTKKEPGPLYGVSKDVWAALAVGVTHLDAADTHQGGR